MLPIYNRQQNKNKMPKGYKGRITRVPPNGVRATTNRFTHHLCAKNVPVKDIFKLSSMVYEEYNKDEIEKMLKTKIIEEDRVPIADLD